jgi:hypothetical protein
MQLANHFDLGETLLEDERKGLIHLEPVKKELESDEKLKNGTPYFIDDNDNLCRWKQTRDGNIPVTLCNFQAQIIKEITEDNGIETNNYFYISGKTKYKNLPEIPVATSKFTSLNWLAQWGNQAITEPGQNTRDYIRHAIQVMSKEDLPRVTRFTHTGWRKINNRWVYLTASGGIGAENITVSLPRELQRYSLPLLPENEVEAIRASLSFLDIAEGKITLPLWALLYLSILTTILESMPNFSGYIYGLTGALKTTLALMLQSHFGYFPAISLLQNFEDTANSLEKRSFILKDALMVLDDFHPSNKKADAETMEGKAQRLIRSYSNRTGRGRLNADTTDKGRYEPRGMLLITGEELVSLQSTLARVIIIEICKGDIDLEKLTALQQKAKLLPHAMTSFIHWVSNNIQEIKTSFPNEFIQLRQKAYKDSIHAKLPEQVAFLQFALNTILSWIIEKNILTENQAKDLSQKGWDIFMSLADKHSKRIEREDPIKKFTEILDTLITQGRVKIENKDISMDKTLGGVNSELIGWYDDLYFYFMPQALWHSLQEYCIKEGMHFPVKKHTFYEMIEKRGLIADKDKGKHVKTEWIKGASKKVLKTYRQGICQMG